MVVMMMMTTMVMMMMATTMMVMKVMMKTIVSVLGNILLYSVLEPLHFLRRKTPSQMDFHFFCDPCYYLVKV